MRSMYVVATWNLGNHLSICLQTQGNQEKPVSRWPVAGPSGYRILASSPASKVKTAIHTQYSKLLLLLLLLLLLFTAIGLSPSGSGYFTCKQKMKLVTTKFKSGGLHEKHVVATWNLGNHLSICFSAQGNREKPVSRWLVNLL